MTSPAANILRTIAALNTGDVVTIEAGGKTRTVKVDRVAPGGYVYVTSGAVRPGHVLGGVIRIASWGVTYQPTMQQPAAEIVRIERHAVLAFAVAS